MEHRDSVLLDILKKEIVPATGCTEPVAVAYSTAVARQKLGGTVEKLEITVDGGLYKNGMKVGIPGIKERGLDIAGALGLTAGSPDKNLQVIDSISLEALNAAKELVALGKVKVSVKEACSKLYVETLLHTSEGKIRIITTDRHLNIVQIDGGDTQLHYTCESEESGKSESVIQGYGLEDFIKFSKSIPLEAISFLEQGANMNMALAKEGISMENGISKKLELLANSGLIQNGMIYRAQLLCAAASEARMSGSKLPAMSSAGSGNHGITVFLTNCAVAENLAVPREALIRALALSNLITFYIKSFTGTLSAMCGCGVAAGIGASAGVVYLLGGGEKEILGTVLNMIGSISGIICDGGKEGCSYKLALSSGWAVQSALMSMVGCVVNNTDGILSSDFKEAVRNMGYVCNPGMIETNNSIIKVMTNSL